MKKILQISTILIVIIVIVFLGWFYINNSVEDIASFEDCVKAGYPVMDSYPEQCQTPDGRVFTKDVYNNGAESKKDLIVVSSPQPFMEITSPLLVTGEARGSWYFEADFPIKLEDMNGNIISQGVATAKLDPNDPEATWMTEDFVPFEGVLEFNTPTIEAGVLVLEKDNPSGLLEHADELRIPVRFKTKIRIINIYYYNPLKDQDENGNILCSDAGLVAVQRSIPFTNTPVQDAVSLLLKGEILPQEESQGITTEFPLEGLELEGANMENGVLTLGISDPNNTTIGGSCRVGILWFQIRETARQFDGIDEVRFEPEDLFQP